MMIAWHGPLALIVCKSDGCFDSFKGLLAMEMGVGEGC